jgi:hypothetical protein
MNASFQSKEESNETMEDASYIIQRVVVPFVET